MPKIFQIFFFLIGTEEAYSTDKDILIPLKKASEVIEEVIEKCDKSKYVSVE